MTDRESLVRQRGGHKGVITGYSKKIESAIGRNNLGELSSLRDVITSAMTKIQKFDSEILALTDVEGTINESMEQADYQMKVSLEVHKINIAITKILGTMPSTPEVPPVPVTPRVEVKLPKLNIKQFDGDVLEWTSFWELFSASVHNRADFEVIQKFSYLKGLLEGEALELISGFKLTADTYGQAVELLQETYGKKDELKLCLVRKLLQTENPSLEAESLKRFRAQFECAIRSLQSEKLELNEFFAILLYDKLPRSLSETVKRRCGDDWLKYDVFKKHLEEEISNLRVFSPNDASSNGNMSSISTFTVNQTPSVRPKTNKPREVAYKMKSSTQLKKCTLCDGEHWWTQCGVYGTRNEKINRIKSLRLCYVCTSAKHFSTDCEKPSCNNGCRLKHHRNLCDRVQNGKTTKTKSNGIQIGTLSVKEQGNKGKNAGKRSILPTATIALKGKGGHVVRLRGLLDTCAERTFIKRTALKGLQYRSKGKEKIALRGYLTSKPVQEYEMVSVAIPCKGRLIVMDCIVVDELPEYTKKFDVKRSLRSLCKTKINLADRDFDLPVEKQSNIEMLIGVDNVYNILHPGFRRVKNLVLLPTIFGYVVTGICNAPPTKETQVTVLKLAAPMEEIEAAHSNDPNSDLESLWSLDRLGIDCSELKEQDQKVLKDFESTIEYSEVDKQYIVALPWKTNRFKLTSNFGLAMNRLRQQCIKFQNDVNYLDHYQKILQEQEDRRFIERVVCDESKVNCHYLPHHGVRRDSVTTPIRIVFDCSSKQGKTGLSLNDCLWTGPHVTADLLRVLLQFRSHIYACTSDIEKAFLMVQLREEDRDFTRFLWLKDPTDPTSETIVYRFRVVLFGATCSPFLLNATIQHHLSAVVMRETRTKAVDVVEKMKRGLYVDNLQITANSESELINLYFGANEIFAEAHLYLKEWVSNSLQLQTVAAAYRIAAEQKPFQKVLGLKWDTKSDVLTINSGPVTNSGHTKREILSTVARIYDPLGMLLPITMKARMFLQNLWKQHLTWDEELSEILQQEWDIIHQDLMNSLDITFPRSAHLGTVDFLHIFCDASKTSYGCVAYRTNNTSSKLLMAKGRVAPIKELTIPKLELMALLLGARMAKFILDSFKEGEFKQLFLWSDSKVALSWIVSKNALPVFVRNRVNEINTLIPEVILSYVPSLENPSDWITRGKMSNVLAVNSFWWEGPPWLKNHISRIDRSWMSIAQTQDIESDQSVFVNTESSTNEDTRLLDWERFSTTDKIFKTMAWILRFVHNCKCKHANVEKRTGNLTLEELQEAKKKAIVLVQKEYYLDEYEALWKGVKQPKLVLIRQLNLYMENDVIRCRGRLEYAMLPETTKFPILLPKGCILSKLIVRHHHVLQAHMGVNATVASVRQEFWIPQLRQLAKSILHHCVICKRVQGKAYRPNQVPPLPEFRVNQKQPFAVTGVDYTGALWIKEGNRIPEKVYIALFTCPITRGIHLELVRDQSADSFLLAFRRFCGRRGFPALMLSDNATTFVAAAEHLKNMADSTLLREHLNDIECKWRFIPARAPWFGAIWERLIGLMKNCMKKVIGRALLSYDELSCVLTELESIINDRPLGYVAGDINQLEILTPNHLILGRKLKSFPKEVLDWEEVSKDPLYGESKNIGRRYLHVTKLNDHLWKRWEKEYLTSLRETHQCKTRHESWPKIGDIVLIHDEGPRNKWKLGQVIQVHAGSDKIVRVATLRTAHGQIMRPIIKLYPLELWQELELPDPAPSSKIDVRPSRKTAQMAAEARRDLIKKGLL